MMQFSLKERTAAETHLQNRWEYLGGKGFQGIVTRDQYFSANRESVMLNIRIGLIPKLDGSGYLLSS